MNLFKKLTVVLLVQFFLFSCTNENLIEDEVLETQNSELDPVNKTTLTKPIILGYFPSWSESAIQPGQGSTLRDIPTHVTHVFLAFARPNLRYQKGSLDITGTGIETPYDGATLKESVAALKSKGTKVILSIGGETYWGSNAAYDINYQQIKDLVDDMGFEGIDWDFEPNGSFATIGNPINVQRFIEFFTKSRAIMPKGQYLIACAPAGVGALGGQSNDDPASPYAYSKRNAVTGESDANLYNATTPNQAISLYGFATTGHMIPVMEAVGDKIDLIAYQGYNTGAASNRKIMYDAYKYYADRYGFSIAAGTHYPNEPWGPYYEYTYQNMAGLSAHIASNNNANHGIMIWQLLLGNTSSSAYGYLYISSQVLNGVSQSQAIANAENYPLSPYPGDGNLAPSVSITSPTNNQSVTQGQTINITANASDADGVINKVEFFQGNTKLGEDTTSPYSYSWANAPVGSYNLTAVATDNANTTATSAVVSVTVTTGGPTPPIVSITSPINNQSITQGQTISIKASASDFDGSVSKVEFFQGNTKLGEDTTSPYSYSWTNAPVGSYNLTVVATDNENATTTSTGVSITVITTGGGSCDGVANWAPYPSIYNQGDRAVYQGTLYEAQTGPLWVTPGSGEHWWKTIGTCN
ncbi:Ig-like domain-containing protein [Aquimarina sp. I32.4]|uniref:Ig-like domain-containing protein n=1 Tax=Aquimarina sp. I32.4 TaxID=2053903 RepID=UPI0011AFA542|nr:Ig-like domain-containing protein [Aquimarina sp. I32.4]